MTTNKSAEQAVKSFAQTLESAWNRHDAQGFVTIFADDAEFTNVFGMLARGRGAIEAMHAPLFESIFKDSYLSINETRVRLIRADVASVDLKWSMNGARDPRGNPWPDRSGLMNWIATLHDGQWLVDVSHNMDLPSPALVQARADLS